MKNILGKLLNIQQELKAPKGQTNDFGKYKYRSLENIQEAVKPILKKNNCVLVLTDELLAIDGRFYVEATAILYDVDSTESVSNKAMARESESKKGMDDSQITGTASSYARKYALNGLFAIDDTKDADTNEYHNEKEAKKEKAEKAEKVKKPEVVNEALVDALEHLIKDANVNKDELLKFYKVESLYDLTMEQFNHCKGILVGKLNEKNRQ